MINITPSSVAFTLGPITVDWYGLGYVAALVAGTWIATREAERRGEDPNHVWNAILLVFVCGVVGARLYHVIDQWALYASDPIKIVLPPYTGLGVYGGIAGGIVGVVIYTRHHRLSFLRWADIAVPALLVGQAIGRWGNFFNQELYGPPTTLPWGIAIDCQHRVAAYPCSAYPFATTGFHPLFLYESLLNAAGALIALYLAHRMLGRLRDGDLMSFWFIWYGSVRSLLEPLRDSYNWTFFGVPVAILVGIGAITFGVVTVWWRHRGPAPLGARAGGGEDAGAEEMSTTAEAGEHAASGPAPSPPG